VSKIYQELTRDRASASKYTEQLIKVKGKVVDVETAKRIISLEGDAPTERVRVLCRNEDQLSLAAKGKTITAVGYCHGLVQGAVEIGQGYVSGAEP
jgi:hypothetical protein